MLPEIEELATVVVCEDDDPTRELLCDHLTADRYRALPAPSAADALRLCGYNQPDLMLLDLGLPDAAGIDVLREIRSADGATGRFDPELPVIVLRGRGERGRPGARLRGRAPTTTSSSPSTTRSWRRAWRRCCAAANGGAQGPIRVGELRRRLGDPAGAGRASAR